MLIRKIYRAQATKQSWSPKKFAPVNGQVLFELWGAPGAIGGGFAEGPHTPGKQNGSKGTACDSFHNQPGGAENALGNKYANGAGYAAGILTGVAATDSYTLLVGQAGGPGNGTISLDKNGNYHGNQHGGNGGWPDGGDGGDGAITTQNLYNSVSDKVQHVSKTMPNQAKVNALWYDTGNHLVKKCNTAYSSGNGTAGKWTTVTDTHGASAGGGGGGGGGSTSVVNPKTKNRILVAGGGGGAGGQWNKTGTTAWLLRRCPDGTGTPRPPFGNDTTATGPRDSDPWDQVPANRKFFYSQINYLAGGWGTGGLGGATGPLPGSAPTADGGSASVGGSGGPASARHASGTNPRPASGTGGSGGSAVSGGRSGGMGATSGAGGPAATTNRNGHNSPSSAAYNGGQGGNGATAKGGFDDFTSGGGGGGGGFFGGGGGGAGFRSDTAAFTKAGGGGGGSNYASNAFSRFVLAGGVRPPFSTDPTLAPSGRGGFARVTWREPGTVSWVDGASVSVLGGSSLTLNFAYTPAVTAGVGVKGYIIGTNSTTTASTPSSQTTIMVNDSTISTFTRTITAPAAGTKVAYYVQVIDMDGDATVDLKGNAWAKVVVTGLSASATTPATITAPAANAVFSQSATVNWTVGTQTPLVAYRIGVQGNDMTTGAARKTTTGWHRSGSRVNFATDPGFTASAVWTSPNNNALVGGDTSFPGVSGKNGKISWALTNNFDASNQTATWDNLMPQQTYRLHLEVASNRANDIRTTTFMVYDNTGPLPVDVQIDTSTLAAGSYATVDIEFTPSTQGVYLVLIPSGSGYGTQYVNLDFEDATAGGFSAPAVSDGTQALSGNLSIKCSGSSTFAALPYLQARNVTATTTGTDNTLVATSGTFVQTDVGLVVSGTNIPAGATITAFTDATHVTISANTTGAGSVLVTVAVGAPAGEYLLDIWGFAPTASTTALAPTVSGTGVTNAVTATSTVKNSWVNFRIPFTWNGFQAVNVTVSGEATNFHWWDDVQIYSVDATTPQVGNTDSGQATYLRNMLLELRTLEDGASGYRPYFDGSNLNGNPGSVAWSGAANASASVLTATDVVTDTATYSGAALSNGQVYLDTMSSGNLLAAAAPVTAVQSVKVNPSLPATPTVSLVVDSTTGIQTLTINAADGANATKTVSFDVFRNGTRIVTGLTPNDTTRIATYMDAPGHAVAAVYTVRAWDTGGGYADQGTGTVTLVS